MRSKAVHGAFLWLLLAGMPAGAAAQDPDTLKASLADAGRTLRVTHVGGGEAVDVVLTGVLVQYPHLDNGCDAESPVRLGEQKLQWIWPGTTRVLGLSELGLDLPETCETYVVTVLAHNPASGERSVASIVSEPAASLLGTVDCTQPPQSTQIVQDLVLTNEIDLNAIPVGSCLGLREYSAQLRNTAGSTTYGVSLNSKYICTRNLQTPDNCNTPPTMPLPGPGWNQGVETPGGDGSLSPGECLPFEYRNDVNFFSLPNCCDNLNVLAIAQCTSFAVTSINGLDCSPAFISSTTFSSETRGGAVQFGCNFSPTNHSTAESFRCEGDCDTDGTTDGCESAPEEMDLEVPPDGICNGVDNCPSTFNPAQQDADSDSRGDLCDNCPSVFNPSQEDADGDNRGAACDCDDLAQGVWAVPGEALDLRLSYDATTMTVTLDWDPPSDLGGGTVAYDTLSSATSTDFVGGLTCVESNDSADTSSSDTGASVGVLHYLIRAENSCPGQGTVGSAANGVRNAGPCP